MKIAVLSGKGGAGKTLVAVNLAAVAGASALYADGDVEEPNGRLFLKPSGVERTPVYTLRPRFDRERCTGCRKCVEFCRFNALVYLKDRPMLFDDVCHACGGCLMVCPSGAVSEEKREVGGVESGWHGELRVLTGVLNTGVSSGIPVIEALQRVCSRTAGTVIVDGPPGSACGVMACVRAADLSLIVAEPTAFGFHNFKMVWKLVGILGKRCAVVVNKQDAVYEPFERFCREHGVPIFARIPYSASWAGKIARGEVISESDSSAHALFSALLERIREETE